MMGLLCLASDWFVMLTTMTVYKHRYLSDGRTGGGVDDYLDTRSAVSWLFSENRRQQAVFSLSIRPSQLLCASTSEAF